MTKKPLYLFLALVLPVLIYFFLKLFGSNRFDLPVMHRSDTEWPASCQRPDVFPFSVADSVLSRSDKPVLVIFRITDQETLIRLPLEIDSAKVIFRWEEPAGVGVHPCAFGATPDAGAVLIDQENRVRGIYKALTREEADRLIMETKIITGDY